MRRVLLYVLLAVLVIPVACNEEQKLELEQLQASLEELQNADGSAVPQAVVPALSDGPFAIVFDQQRYGVDAGSSVTVGYTLSEACAVTVSTREGWTATVNATGATTGTITLTAPDPAAPATFTVTATAENGKIAAAIIPLIVRDPYTDATRTQANLLGYYSLKPQHASEANFQKLADAGLNMVTVECEDYDFKDQVARAWKVGMKSLAIIGFAGDRWAGDPDNYKYLDELVGYLKEQPGTLAYHVFDEPSTDRIPRLKRIREKIESLDPEHPVYINLNPDGSSASLGTTTYRDYIEAFARDCGVKFLSFDMYPILTDGTYMQGWHMCLRAVSDMARKYGIPFWAFAASCHIDNEGGTIVRGRPSVENLRLQAYTDMVYGAQVVQFFTIQQYGGTTFAPIMLDGTWTEAYDYLKTACHQIQKRGYVFNGCSVEDIRFTDSPAIWGDALSQANLPQQIESIAASGTALVSFIENRGNRYIAMVNQSYTQKISVEVTFNDMVYTIEPDGSFTEHRPGSEEFVIDEGDLMVIKYE